MKPINFFTKIDWKLVKKEINRRLNTDYDSHYLQATYRGKLFSSKIKENLDEILPPFQKRNKAA
jgi:hypothetical protein